MYTHLQHVEVLNAREVLLLRGKLRLQAGDARLVLGDHLPRVTREVCHVSRGSVPRVTVGVPRVTVGVQVYEGRGEEL